MRWIIDDAAKVLADPKAYTDEAGLHAALTHLRKHAPVSYVDVPDYRPFWAIAKHADIMAKLISIQTKQNELHPPEVQYKIPESVLVRSFRCFTVNS